MRLLISIGMVIIFVSAFFIMFTIDSLVKNDLNCVIGKSGKTLCNFSDVGFGFLIKLIVVAFFILIDILTVYMIATNVMPRGTFFMDRAGEDI